MTEPRNDALEQLGAYLTYLDSNPDDAVGLHRMAKRLLPLSMHSRLRALVTDVVRPLTRLRASRLASQSPLLLHLGSGRFRKPGWVNIDLALGAPTDLAWNLKHPLPFAEGSVDAIFHEHLLEHLELRNGLKLTLGCHSMLRDGGVLRIGVPDAGAYARGYALENGFIDQVRPGRPTRLLALQEVFYLHGHRTAYDAETLELVLRAAGFEVVEPRSFGESLLEPAPDSDERRPETLYVEAVK